MTPDDKAFTVAWWDQLLVDEPRMIRWLQKLHGTEFSGFQDNYDAAIKWGGDNLAVINVFKQTGDDEMRHAALLEDLLKGRGAWPIEVVPEESAYWAEMDKYIVDLKTCAAVFFLGEHLAAERFQVLLDHPGTPADIRYFLERALPDERHHARVFNRMTDSYALIQMAAIHDRTVRTLKGL